MRVNKIGDGLTPNSPQQPLYVTDVARLDKDMGRVTIDLVNGIADRLPEGMGLKRAVREGANSDLILSCEENARLKTHPILGHVYYDEAGNEYECGGYTWTYGGIDLLSGQDGEEDGRMSVRYTLHDYPYDTAVFSPSFSRITNLETPIEIMVKQ